MFHRNIYIYKYICIQHGVERAHCLSLRKSIEVTEVSACPQENHVYAANFGGVDITLQIL